MNIDELIIPTWCSDLLILPIHDIIELMKLSDFLAIDILVNVICIKIAIQ